MKIPPRPIPPERATLILKAILDNMNRWSEQLSELERTCACSAAQHLGASIRQGRTSLTQLIERSRD